MDMIQTLAQELNKDPRHVENVVRLLDEGNTIPFIARYRKELHGAMDDTSLRTLEERLQYLRGLEERRDTVKKSIEEQGKLTEELAAAIDSAQTLAEVEDLYRPYKQKRRTRATVAREKGLEPLAALLFAQERDCPRPEDAAAGFIDSEKGVETAADALQGANDIIAEWISDDAAVRKSLRELLERRFTPEELAEYTRELTAAHARRMDGHLRALYPGAAVLTTGGCMLCAACTRPAGRPCRHPEAVGYSLESLGCDVGAAARGELGWELLWPRRDRLPRYLTLLCAVLR